MLTTIRRRIPSAIFILYFCGLSPSCVIIHTLTAIVSCKKLGLPHRTRVNLAMKTQRLVDSFRQVSTVTFSDFAHSEKHYLTSTLRYCNSRRRMLLFSVFMTFPTWLEADAYQRQCWQRHLFGSWQYHWHSFWQWPWLHNLWKCSARLKFCYLWTKFSALRELAGRLKV